MMKYRQGFTLIELLVVVAIIGVLAGIVLPALGTARQKAYDVKVKAQLKNIQTAAANYLTSNNSYGTPTSICGTTSPGMFSDLSSGLGQLTVSASARRPVRANQLRMLAKRLRLRAGQAEMRQRKVR